MNESWIERWKVGQTGWHEPDGNRNLQAHCDWTGKRVLVPLCGATPDLLWLEARGNEVVGVELSDIAVKSFFDTNDLEYELEAGTLDTYRCKTRNITLYCGDYFDFSDETFNAHYDRGALIALPPDMRARYAAHTSSLLGTNAAQLVLTLIYDDSVAQGPPFYVSSDELLSYWPNLAERARVDDTPNAPPKFLKAGLDKIEEVVWTS